MLSIRCVFDVCELDGGESGFAEWLSDGRFELIRLSLGGRFVFWGRSDLLLLDVLLLFGDVAGRFAARLSAVRFPVERFSAARFPAGPDTRACFGDIAGAW